MRLYANRRYNVSATRIPKDARKDYAQDVHWKPSGLWYAFGRSWLRFIRTNARMHVHEVTVDLSRMARIGSVADACTFAERYGVHDLPGSGALRVDWPAVAKDFAGVEVFPYTDAMRFGGDPWLYTWDVPSGCVWDLTALKRYRYLGRL